MKAGYIRISTREQNTARQDLLMQKFGVEKVYTDRMSGKSQERPELRRMMDFVREGDSLTVESISRFARNTRDLLELTAALEAKGVQFISMKESIDTSTPTGKFMLAVFGALAELERENILEPQADGIAIAKAEGRMNGRPKKAVDTFEAVYLDVKAGKLSATAAAKQLGISRSTYKDNDCRHLGSGLRPDPRLYGYLGYPAQQSYSAPRFHYKRLLHLWQEWREKWAVFALIEMSSSVMGLQNPSHCFSYSWQGKHGLSLIASQGSSCGTC